MSRHVHIRLVADASEFVAQMKKATEAIAKLGQNLASVRRRTWRMTLTPGEQHIDKVCQEIRAGVPGRDPVVRLIAAADFAAVLDGKEFAA